MSHADEFVRARMAELRVRYPVLPACLSLSDSPTTDFPIADYLGFGANGCAVLRFD